MPVTPVDSIPTNPGVLARLREASSRQNQRVSTSATVALDEMERENSGVGQILNREVAREAGSQVSEFFSFPQNLYRQTESVLESNERKHLILELHQWSLQGSDVLEINHRKIATQRILHAIDTKSVVLDLSSLELTSFPNVAFDYLFHLEELHLSFNRLSCFTIPERALPRLQWLFLSHNQLSHFQISSDSFSGLQGLILSDNQLTTFDVPRSSLQCLETLDLSSNQLTKVYFAGDALFYLKHLFLRNNQLDSFDVSRGAWQCLQSLFLDDNCLRDFRLFQDSFPNLVTLYLSHNQITEIPEEIFTLKYLEELDISNNRIEQISSNMFAFFHRILTDLHGNPVFESFQRVEAMPEAVLGLPDLFSYWLDPEQRSSFAEQLSELERRPEALFLALFLNQLMIHDRVPQDYRGNVDALRKKMQTLIEKGCYSTKTMDTLCTYARLATESCGDGIAYYLAQMEGELDVLKSPCMNHRELADFLVKRHRSSRLEEFVRHLGEQKNFRGEDLEVALFLKTRLADLLLYSPVSMLYRDCAEIEQDEEKEIVEMAREYILQSLETKADCAQFLQTQMCWVDRLKSTESAEKILCAMNIQIEELEEKKEASLMNDEEYLASIESLKKEYERKLLELTQTYLS